MKSKAVGIVQGLVTETGTGCFGHPVRMSKNTGRAGPSKRLFLGVFD